ncbi:hypothetical protein TIFTF001_000320 [Ficus carica]|uniref:DUF674 family protein n=1 Tax=Ficus carica TaxID=3494 RepID=A0AA88CMX4_FICCA|nr:hypothetical protein TIFTF001_000320 [Ficus carica]
MCDEITPPGEAKPAGDGGVFVKATNKFIISGDLQVMVPRTTTILSLLSKSGVMDGSTIEERTFNLGVKEVLGLLMCSFVSRTPLVETLQMDKPVLDRSNSNFVFGYRGRTAESHIKEETKNQEQDIFVKLYVSKSKKMVCYAEAKTDFVNLIFSFLTIPLGHVVKHVNNDGSFKGCINRFYKSVQDLDEQCFNSSAHKEILVCPRVAPGFSYENSLLGIKEAAPPACYYFSHRQDRYLLSSTKCHRRSYEVGPIQMTAMFSKSHDKDGESRGGFLKEPNWFTVTDNLVIKPITAMSVLSVLNELKVPFSDIKERTVHVGKQEALRLLLSSFVSESALTNAFIK